MIAEERTHSAMELAYVAIDALAGDDARGTITGGTALHARLLGMPHEAVVDAALALAKIAYEVMAMKVSPGGPPTSGSEGTTTPLRGDDAGGMQASRVGESEDVRDAPPQSTDSPVSLRPHR